MRPTSQPLVRSLRRLPPLLVLLLLAARAPASEPGPVTLPARLDLAADGRVVPVAGGEEVRLSAVPGHALRHRWYRDGELFLDRAGPPEIGIAIDSVADDAGPPQTVYRLEVVRVPAGPVPEKDRGNLTGSTFVDATRTYRVEPEGAARAPDPLPPGAVARLGTVRFRRAGVVTGLAFSPDGSRLAVASRPESSEPTVTVVDPDTGKLLYASDRATGLSAPEFSPDGTELALAGGSSAVLRDARTGAPKSEIPMVRWSDAAGVGSSGSRLAGVRYSPDGRLIALFGWVTVERLGVGGAIRTVSRQLALFDRKTGREVLRFDSDRPVDTVAFSSDSKRLAAADGLRVRVWNLSTGKPVFTETGSDRTIALAFTPDGDRLLVAARDGLRALDAATGEVAARVEGTGVSSFALGPDGKLVATGGFRTIRLHDPRTLEVIREFRGGDDSITAFAFAPDRTHLASACGHAVRIWDLKWTRARNPRAGHEDGVVAAAFSPDGRIAATAGRDGTVRLWRPATGAALAILRGPDRFVNDLAFAPDGKELVFADPGYLRFFDPVSGESVRTTSPAIDGKEAVAWRSDGGAIALGGRDGSVALVDPATGKLLRRWPAPDGLHGIVRNVVFSADGKRLAAREATDGRVRLFSPDSDDPPRVLGTREPPVLAIAFAPDGGRLIALRRDSVVVDLETGETIAGIANPGPGEISAAAWSPDGRTLAIGESDGSVRLLDAATGKPLATWRGHRGPVLCLAFSPRGRRVISGSEDTTGLVWPVPAR